MTIASGGLLSAILCVQMECEWSFPSEAVVGARGGPIENIVYHYLSLSSNLNALKNKK